MNGDRFYGGYLLSLPARVSSSPVSLTVRYRSGMSNSAMFFSVDRRRDGLDLPELARSCGLPEEATLVDGAAEILSAASNSYPLDTGRWSVKKVF
jgi:hypothetical protein